MDNMFINRMPLRCRTCMHDWMHENKLPASVMKFVDAMQQLRCPQCHASMLALNIEFGMTTLRSHSK
jgi:Zn finger protein HypA/HybF involved in hydrogenase expression